MTTQNNPFLPEEVITNILLRLPAKSIGRCRCVSKPWLSLLSQPHFINTHTPRTRTTTSHLQSLLLVANYSNLYYTTSDNAHQVFDEMCLRPTKLDFVDHSDYWLSAVSCDGFVLIASANKLCLLNPLTHQVKHIPFYKEESASTIYGLGYDSVNHDYKIVTLLTHYFGKCDSLVKVYSVKNGAWKNLENRLPYDCPLRHGVFINGYIHWLVSSVIRNKSKILSFDLAKEKFCEAFLPIAVTNDIKYDNINEIVSLGGCLCVFSSSYNGENCVWIMKEYCNNESWTKFTFIDPLGEPCKAICLLDQEQVLVERNSVYVNKLVKYNLKNGTYKDIVVDGIDSGNIYVAATFVDSLVSPYCSHETS